ncbi:MlaE family lipid ABC transporter permease subunit [Marinobacter litoralis]|uniref:MlaE family lipid ABC transporter permease subunit n=1 Tax=Marinobacter litoralis TaxID=187981 RepID=UPI0039B754A3
MAISPRQSSRSHEPSAGNAELSDSGLTCSGDWTLSNYTELARLVEMIQTKDVASVPLDVSQLGRVDTAGASLLVKLVGPSALIQSVESSNLATEQQALISTVASAMKAEPRPEPRTNPLLAFVASTGERVTDISRLVWLLAGFIGQTLAALFYILPRPTRWRITSFVAAVHDTGLNALPIVALLTFLVGSVVAFLGATVLQDFGATIYTVNLVAFSFLREFGVLLAAILLAGRTASSFTAHIGAMKVNEELDAIRTLGLNPVELLVVPRVLAMMVSLPVLTFVGMISGMIGGAVVCAITLDIPPSQYLAIVERDIGLTHFLVGIGKAPVFAFLIAVIGCLEGFKVAGSAQSVGEHTTSSVVQSIFMVILLDSIAALFFMEMGW